MLVFEERGKQDNQQQTQATYGVAAGIRTRATLVGGERSHHSAIPRLDYQPLFGEMSPHSSPEKAAGRVQFPLLV